MNLDNELKNALRRQPGPDGFAERVMARIEKGEAASRESGRAGTPVLHRAAAVLALVALLGGWGAHQAAERRRAGEQAKEEVLLALRIASEKVNDAQERVREIGAHD